MKERISNFNVKSAFVSDIIRLIQPFNILLRFVILLPLIESGGVEPPSVPTFSSALWVRLLSTYSL
jgi:hypothetical protein